VGISQNVIFNEADRIWRRNLILLGLVGILALMAAWLGGDVFILRRLRMLVAAADRLRTGDLSARTGVTSRTSEFNHLAAAFDEMAAALEQREAERQQTVADLEAQRGFLRQVIDIDPNFIFAKDRQGRFTLANQAVADAYGTTVENLLGKTDAEFNPSQAEVNHFQNDDLAVMDSLREKFIPEETITDAAGQVRWLQTVKRPLIGPDGQALQVLGVATDITERKRNEQTQSLLAESRERSRLAQELHDTVSQALGYLNVQIGRTTKLLAAGQIDEAQVTLHELKQVVGEVYTDVREEIFNLRANTYVGLNFLELLGKYIDKYHRFYDLDIQRVEETETALFDFPADVTPQLIRTIQEALINIRKHARVKQAVIRLRRQGGQVRIIIEDQGQGFDLGRVKEKATSFGLQIMRERVESVGGSLEIDTAPGQGTRIILSFNDMPDQ
jgi:PAS domain S-box-containing protein